MKEIEVKARVRNPAELTANIEKLGIQLGDVITQSDTIFVPHEIMALPTEKGVPVLRIRQQGEKIILTMKIRLTNGLDKQESETEITNPVGMKEIILATGFKEIESFTKKRRKGKYNNWEICVDEVEGLGNFVEVEQLSEDGDSEQIQKELFNFLQGLGITEADREHFGYDVLIWQARHQK
jgi:adenylate cyclase class 2